MIGVIATTDQAPVVEEFFQLFKTPWEYYAHGRRYDVVVATTAEVPSVDARLLFVFGAGARNTDDSNGIALQSRQSGGFVHFQGTALPIYGDLAVFDGRSRGMRCLAAESGTTGLRFALGTGTTIIRLGYDLLEEVRFLLSAGQPVEQAHIPALDIHISILRTWILSAGIPLLEIAPIPFGSSCAVCLTHDIDFVGIQNHKLDHTMWGFLYRSTVGAVVRLLQRKITISRLLETWRAAASLPFVYLGWIRDFWEPFEWYLEVEKGLAATYFFIPFKGRAGDRVASPRVSRRAAASYITQLSQTTSELRKEGCEIGVHGIDAWHSVEKGRDELTRISGVTGETNVGVRMHWLLRDEDTFRVLELAGYAYDSTVGYNETVGYQSGTTQPSRPLGIRKLLELPVHIQDGALFFPERLDLSEADAWKRCEPLVNHAKDSGGVLTIIWHDRSHGPERFWGGFYKEFVQTLKGINAWFGTAGQVVSWFGKRREVSFERLETADGIARECRNRLGPPVDVIHRGPGCL